MRRTAFALGAALIVLTSAGSALAWKPVHAPVLSDNAAGAKLDWRIKPARLTVEGVARDFNLRTGAGTVECVLDKNGRPDNCVAVGEQRADLVKFAGRVAGFYKASSKDSLGQSIAGRKVTFSIEFDGESDL